MLYQLPFKKRTYATGFVKRGLIHASNFSTLSSTTQLEVYLKLWNFVTRLCYQYTKVTITFSIIRQLRTNKVMPHPSCVIGCLYKTLFANLSHMLIAIWLFYVYHTGNAYSAKIDKNDLQQIEWDKHKTLMNKTLITHCGFHVDFIIDCGFHRRDIKGRLVETVWQIAS